MVTSNFLSANGKASKNPEIRNRQQKEADSFNAFGMRIQDLILECQMTKNPILKEKLQEMIKEWNMRSKKSGIQNELNFQKLDSYKEDALGMGLRKVETYLAKYGIINNDSVALLLSKLIALEHANIEAKRHKGEIQKKIYERKCILLDQVEQLLYECGWKYGISYAVGKNASYLVFVYLPNGRQLSWHCNEFDIATLYPSIDAEWDGEVCSTLDKLFEYVGMTYFSCNNIIAA